MILGEIAQKRRNTHKTTPSDLHSLDVSLFHQFIELCPAKADSPTRLGDRTRRPFGKRNPFTDYTLTALNCSSGSHGFGAYPVGSTRLAQHQAVSNIPIVRQGTLMEWIERSLFSNT